MSFAAIVCVQFCIGAILVMCTWFSAQRVTSLRKLRFWISDDVPGSVCKKLRKTNKISTGTVLGKKNVNFKRMCEFVLDNIGVRGLYGNIYRTKEELKYF